MSRVATIFLVLLAIGLAVFVGTTERWRSSPERTIQPGSPLFDFDPEDMMKRLAAGMEGWKRGDMAPNPPAPTNVFKPGVYHVEKEIPQGKVYIGARSITRDDPDYFAALVMNEILGVLVTLALRGTTCGSPQ